ncbi:hypothetical protein [Neorhizobium galegae]|uniref:hypothetical protein n=1 Tax=Neorhizobium galegae TaxID=399 RepID=UPI0006210958|nr:hypothetical protein [Neorhizobium galegae]CDZ55104.1 Hypothetical protein NGAL_HAMBI2427_60050 [Neorhizobium galegae bv. orientalis]
MRIDRASCDDVYHVALRMRDRDFEEFAAVSPCDTREDLAALLAERYGGREDVICGGDGSGPICIGGTIEARPNVLTLLFFATDDFPNIALPATRFIRNNLFPRCIQAGVHRIEAVSIAGYDHAHEWLQLLGLKPETGPMLGYGKRGEAFIQYARVVDVRPAGA